MRALLVGHRLERDPSLSGCVGSVGADRERPGHEPGHRGARDKCFRCVHLVFWFLAFLTFFWLFRGISSRAEVEFAEEEKDSDSEVLEGTEAARVGLDGLDA